MSGILARYLSGIGTDPLNQQGGMEGFMSQYNVNPYWQQFLQNGNPGLLGQTPQYTQGGQNPYYQNENVYKPETPVEGAKPAFSNKVVGGSFYNPNATADFNKYGDLTMEDGRVLSGAHISKVMSDLEQKGEWDKRNQIFESMMALAGNPGRGNFGKQSAVTTPGAISDLLIPEAWRS